MLVGYRRAGHPRGVFQRRDVVAAAVLDDFQRKVVVWVAYRVFAQVDVHGELLVGFVVVYVGARADASSDAYRPFGDHETGLEEHVLRFRLGVDPQQVVAGEPEAERVVWERDCVMDVVGYGAAREGVVLHIRVIESVENL